MSSDKPSGQSTVVQSNAPPTYAQPFLKKGLQRAETDVLDKPIEFYPHSTVVPFAPQTETALSGIEQRATQGSPLVQGAQDYFGNVISGDYLQANNPYLQSAYEAAARPLTQSFQEDIIPGIQAGFGQSTRLGSGLQARQQERAGDILGTQLSDLAGKMAFQNYADERGRMQQAGLLAPSLADVDYQDLSALRQVGAEREAMAGNLLQEDINRFMQAQTAPQDALSKYMSLVAGGTFGGQSTTQQPIYSDPIATNLGYAAAGGGILSDLAGAGKTFGFF